MVVLESRGRDVVAGEERRVAGGLAGVVVEAGEAVGFVYLGRGGAWMGLMMALRFGRWRAVSDAWGWGEGWFGVHYCLFF